MNEKIVEEVYNRIEDIIMEDVDKNYKSELEKDYKLYLQKEYYDITDEKDYNVAKEIFYLLEKKKWKNLSSNIKEKLLIKDPAMIKIKKIASLAKDYVQKRTNGENFNIENIASNYLLELEDLLEQVKPFNYDEACVYVNDAYQDFNFALGLSEYHSKIIK